jgi:hypothetical protein
MRALLPHRSKSMDLGTFVTPYHSGTRCDASQRRTCQFEGLHIV